MRIAPMSLVLAGAMALWSLAGPATIAAVAAGKPEAPAPARASTNTRTTGTADRARAAKVIRTVETEFGTGPDEVAEYDEETKDARVEETTPEETAPEEKTPNTALRVTAPRVTWVSPRVHGVLFRPATVTLEWTSSFEEPTWYTVTLSRDGRVFRDVVAKWQAGRSARWTLPAQQRTDFFLRVKAMNADGKLLDDDVIPVHVLPENAIVISKANQALWAFEDGRLVHRFTVSTGTKETETRAGWFAVYNRVPDHHSSLYDAPMPYSLFFNGGMAIHASGYIKELGTPASHGCVRVRLFQARSLYEASPVGRPVIVTDWGQDMGYLDATAEPAPVETRTVRRDKAPVEKAPAVKASTGAKVADVVPVSAR